MLQIEIESAIKALPSGGCGCGCLATALIGGVLGVIALVVLLIAGFALLTRPIDVLIINQGCAPLAIRQNIPAAFMPVIDMLGTELPEIVPTGGAGEIRTRSLPISVNVDGTSTGIIEVSLLGYGQSYEYSENLIDVEVNGQSILNQVTTVNLQERPEHTVIITCSSP